jgi:protein phosphatase
MLTRSIGVSEDVKVDLIEIEPRDGDYILLCSDGLTKMLDDNQIEAVFQGEKDPNLIVDRLINQANDAGGGDNITAIVAKVDGASTSFSDRVKGLFKRNVPQRK